MADYLDFDVCVVVHEVGVGEAVAYPLADPAISVYGSADDVTTLLRSALQVQLKHLPASKLSPYFMDGGDIVHIPLKLKLNAVGRLRARSVEVELACLVLPETRGSWVRVLAVSPALNALTFYLDRDEDLAERVEEEMGRALDAFGNAERVILEMAGQTEVRLETVTVSVRRGWTLEGSRSAANRREELRRAQDLELLKSIGTFIDGQGVRHLENWLPREAEQQKLEALTAGSRRLSCLVVGESGVGKSTLIRRLAEGSKQVLSTSGTRLVAGQSMLGQVEERVWDVLSAAERLDVVLYFDTLEELLSGRDGSSDLAGLIRPWLEQERVRIVGEIEPGRLDALSRRHVAFFSLLHTLQVEPMSREQTQELLKRRAAPKWVPRWKKNKELRRAVEKLRPAARFADDKAIAVLVDHVERYFPYGRLPGQAVRLADELCALQEPDLKVETGSSRPAPWQAVPQSEEKVRGPGLHTKKDKTGSMVQIESTAPILTADQIHRGLSRITGIPEMLLREDKSLKLDFLRQGLKRRLIGQGEAVERLAGTLCSVKARLQPDDRPLAVLLFVGPTGVGKTQAARALASLLYGDSRRMLRFDMSEYGDPGAADRLIQGTDRDEGLLTREVRRQPFSVLLLDEIEKADDAVFDLLLQVFGEGRLSDAKGKTAYFHNCMIILTSNLGASERRSTRTGFATASASDSSRVFYEDQVRKRFRPELVNRLDKIVPFEPLTQDELCQVAELQISDLSTRRGFEERGLRLHVEPSVIRSLAEESYSPENGARALRRHLRGHLVEPLAEWLAGSPDEIRNGELWLGPPDGSEDGGKPTEPDEQDAAQGSGSPKDRIYELAGRVLRFRRHTAVKKDAGDSTLRGLQNQRREMRSLLAGDRLSAVRDQCVLLERQIYDLSARSRRRNKKAAAVAQELQRSSEMYQRLKTVYEPLQELRTQIEDIEEMALGAMVAGENVEPWLNEARGFHRRWLQALPAALLAMETVETRAFDRLTLTVEEPDALKALGFWLPGLLEKAKELGWSVEGRTLVGKIMGSPRNSDELLELVDNEERRFRALLVTVQGTGAGLWLAPEAGLHRFHEIGAHNVVAYLKIRRLCFGPLKPKALAAARSLGVGTPIPIKQLKARDAKRTYYMKSGRVLLAGVGEVPVKVDEYWSRYEMILAWDLLRYEHDETLDRDKELTSCLWKGEDEDADEENDS